MFSRDGYLAEIERRALQQGVPEDMCRALVIEIAAHLDATIQARMETGETPDAATQNALNSFGDPKKIVASFAQVHTTKPPRIYLPFLLSTLVATGLYSLAFATPAGAAALALLVVLSVAIIWFIVESYRARRLQVLSLLVAAVPTWVAILAVLSVNTVTLSDGGSYRVDDLPRAVAEHSRIARLINGNADALVEGYEKFKRSGGLLTPRDFKEETGQLVLGKARDEEFARRSWELVSSQIPEMRANAAKIGRVVEEAQAARSQLWIFRIPGNFFTATAGAWLLMWIVFFVHAPVVFLRWFVGEVRRTVKQQKSRTKLSAALPNSNQVDYSRFAHLVDRPTEASDFNVNEEQIGE